MSFIRPTNSFGRGSAPSPGGGGNASAWNNVTTADIVTDDGSYTTFNVTASSQSGFNLNVEQAADIGSLAYNSFPINTAGIIAIDTGLTKADFANGDQRLGTIQLMVEYYNLDSSSSIITDTTYRASICHFIIAAVPPFTSGDMGLFGGSGFFGGNNTDLRMFSRLSRSTTTTSASGGSFFNVAGGNTALSSVSEMTVVQSKQGAPATVDAYLYRYDSIAFIDKAGDDSALLAFNSSQYDGNSPIGSNNIHIGVAFHINTGTNSASPSTTKSWDINIKWRKLLTG